MKVKFKINRKAAFRYNLLAGLFFIFLAVWGWKLPIATVLVYLVICLAFIVIIIGMTALCGFLITKFRSGAGEREGSDSQD